jgi:hypothetical protein
MASLSMASSINTALASYPVLLKVGKNLPCRVVDFRQYATLCVASCPLLYLDHLYSE